MKRFASFGLLVVGAATVAEYARRRRRSPEDIVRAYFAAWDTGDPDCLDGVVCDDYEGHVHALDGTEDRDRERLVDQLRAHAETFTESRFEIQDLVSNGDRVAVRMRFTGVHGDDGRDVEMDGLAFMRVKRGRLVEEWASWDYLGLARQLGFELEVAGA
jgi:ketosteroid isomerase-like protein